MHPYLFDLVIGNFHLKPPTYGFMLALAFSVAYFDSLRRALRVDEDPKHIENLFLIVVLSSVLGARTFHVLFEELPYYLQNPAKIFALWEGGYTFYGAFLSAILGIYLYCRTRKLNFLQFADIAAAPTMMGLFLGRMGCFFAGCCWGRPSDVPWAVVFRHPEAFTNLKNTPLHPAQLYESLGGLFLFFYLNWRFWRRRFTGQLFFEGLIGYAVIRFMVEFFRGDDYRGFIVGKSLSYAQLVSLTIIPFASVGMFLYSRTKNQESKKTFKKKHHRT